MAVSVQLRRGNPTETASFTGSQGEVTIVTPVDSNGDIVSGSASNPWTLRIHDGATAGGHPVIGVHPRNRYTDHQLILDIIRRDS